MSFLTRWVDATKQWIVTHRGMIAGGAIVCSLVFIGVMHANEVFATEAPATSATTATAESGFGVIMSIVPMLIVTVLSAIIWVIGKLIIIVIGMLIVPILGYNNFANSNVISIGWPLVRDVVNMVFILYLLYIAVRTILGLEKSWQDQIVKLFIAAVAVNFSRTICLLVIDFGQVVMFTFVDAIRDIAAGNFVNLFQISDFLSVSWSNASGNAGANAIGYLGMAYVILVFMSMVLAVLLLMAVIFIYRIIVLWILIIMAPAAFFAMAMGLGFAGEWKKKFTGAVLLGPSLAFFLWLALAAASSGPIATSEQFEVLEDPETSGDFDFGVANEIFQIDKLLSLFIALVIIMVGFQVSSQFASSLGGVAADYVNEKTAKKWMKGFAAAPAALGYKGARAAAGAAASGVAGAKSLAKAGGIELARQVDRRVTDINGKSIFASVGQQVVKDSGKLRKIPLIGGWAANKIGGVAGSVIRASDESQEEARKLAAKRVEGMTDAEKQERLRAIAAGGDEAKAFLNMSKDDQDYLRMDYVKRKDARDDFKKEAEDRARAKHAGTLEAAGIAAGLSGAALTDHVNKGVKAEAQKEIDGLEKGLISEVNKRKSSLVTEDKDKAAWLKFQTGRLHLLEDASGAPDVAAMKKIIEDKDFDTKNLTAASLKDPRAGQQIIGLLDGQTAGVDNVDGKPVTRSVADFAESGRGVTAEVRDAMRAERSVVSRMLQTRVDPATGTAKNTLTVEDLTKAFKDGRINVSQLNDAHMSGRGGDIVKAVIDSKIQIDPAQLAALQSSDPTAYTKFTNGVANTLDAGRPPGTANPAKAAAVDAQILRVTGDTEKAYGYGHTTAGNTSSPRDFLTDARGKSNSRETFTRSVKNDVTIINQIHNSTSVAGADLANGTAMNSAVLDAAKGLNMDDLRRAASGAHGGNAAQKTAVKDALDRITAMIGDRLSSPGGPTAGSAEHDRLTDLANAAAHHSSTL